MMKRSKERIARTIAAATRSVVVGLAVATAALPAAAAGGQTGTKYPGQDLRPAASAQTVERETDAAGAVVTAPAPAPVAQEVDANAPKAPQPSGAQTAPPPEARVGVDESNPLPLSMRTAVE